MPKNLHGKTIRTMAIVDGATGEPVEPIVAATGFTVHIRSAVKTGVGTIKSGAFTLMAENQGNSNAMIAGFILPVGSRHTFTCPPGGVLAPIRYSAVHTQLQFIATTRLSDFTL